MCINYYVLYNIIATVYVSVKLMHIDSNVNKFEYKN